MAWPDRPRRRGRARAVRPPRDLRRSFVTPEGVDLRLELGAVGARVAAFALDLTLMLVALIAATVAIAWLAHDDRNGLMVALWLVGAFALRNGWFVLFEMGRRAATPGKRALGLRVVARDGGRLTGSAVIARNAMREIELFLPLSFLFAQHAEGSADALANLFALGWTGILLFFPLTNRDRLRVGDLVAGTWVVRSVRAKLGEDLARAVAAPLRFDDAALDLYGIYELQTLEDVIRRGHGDAIVSVAASIRRKAGLADRGEGDLFFLESYYAALCARLERNALLGRRRADKFQTG